MRRPEPMRSSMPASCARAGGDPEASRSAIPLRQPGPAPTCAVAEGLRSEMGAGQYQRGYVPSAFITGITGQDGQHLVEFLDGRGYGVFGTVKAQNNPRGESLQEQVSFVQLVSGDLAHLPSLVSAMGACQPDEVRDPGAIGLVALSLSQAELAAHIPLQPDRCPRPTATESSILQSLAPTQDDLHVRQNPLRWLRSEIDRPRRS